MVFKNTNVQQAIYSASSVDNPAQTLQVILELTAFRTFCLKTIIQNNECTNCLHLEGNYIFVHAYQPEIFSKLNLPNRMDRFFFLPRALNRRNVLLQMQVLWLFRPLFVLLNTIVCQENRPLNRGIRLLHW